MVVLKKVLNWLSQTDYYKYAIPSTEAYVLAYFFELPVDSDIFALFHINSHWNLNKWKKKFFYLLNCSDSLNLFGILQYIENSSINEMGLN